jgi:hypothetical protein
MARLLDAITRMLSLDDRHDDSVHFHAFEGDQPEVCYDARCARPHLNVN